MPETLLTSSGIKLYGRVVLDLFTWQAAKAAAIAAGATAERWDANAPPPPYAALGGNTFLKNQLAHPDTRLARIYGFSFEGHNYTLPKPAVFLVHTPGTEVIVHGPEAFAGDTTGGGHTTLDASGVIAREWEFSASDPVRKDLRMWEYDKGDFSVRLDIETGTFEEVLLEAALRAGSDYSTGADLRSSGADLRSSGADLRISGADLRKR